MDTILLYRDRAVADFSPCDIETMSIALDATLDAESVPGCDRVAKKIHKLHVSKRTVRRVMEEVEVEAATMDHAKQLLMALRNENGLLPDPTRESLTKLLASGCFVEVLEIKALRVGGVGRCFGR